MIEVSIRDIKGPNESNKHTIKERMTACMNENVIASYSSASVAVGDGENDDLGSIILDPRQLFAT